MFIALQIHRAYYFAFLLLTIVSTASLFAQDGLEKDEPYFKETLSDYQEWLDSTNLSKVLTISALTTYPDFLHLNMKIKSRDDWFDLRDIYKEDYDRSICEDLIRKLSFQMSLDKDSLKITIDAIEDDYPVELSYYNGDYLTMEKEPLLSTKGMLLLKISDVPTTKTTKATGESEQVKELIKGYLKNHYEQKKVWGKKSRFVIIDTKDELSIEISNISKEVLDDFMIGYYEFIMIDMVLEQKGEFVEITYELQMKYGSGIFVAPRRSGYKDMEAKYSIYVERYRKKFRAMMQEVLSAKAIKG
jgi:hypothetical protein